jgi:hypothetical protein
MPEERFDIVFRGQLVDGQDAATVREQVGRLFKASGDQLERLFSGRPTLVKKSVDLDTAARYRLAFRQAGALVEIRVSDAVAEANTPPRQAPPPVLSLLPPHSGSLEDYTPRIPPPPLPDIRHLSLAPPGTLLDSPPPKAAIAIDTRALNLVAGLSWTLEDCQPPPAPAALPDLGHLALSTPGVILDRTPPPVAVSINTDELEVVAGQTWSLEDCQLPPLPEVLPDISSMTLEWPETLPPRPKTVMDW